MTETKRWHYDWFSNQEVKMKNANQEAYAKSRKIRTRMAAVLGRRTSSLHEMRYSFEYYHAKLTEYEWLVVHVDLSQLPPDQTYMVLGSTKDVERIEGYDNVLAALERLYYREIEAHRTFDQGERYLRNHVFV